MQLALFSLWGERRGGKIVFLQNEPKSPFRINKEVGSLMASFGFDRPKKPAESQLKLPIEGYARAFRAVWQV